MHLEIQKTSWTKIDIRISNKGDYYENNLDVYFIVLKDPFLFSEGEDKPGWTPFNSTDFSSYEKYTVPYSPHNIHINGLPPNDSITIELNFLARKSHRDYPIWVDVFGDDCNAYNYNNNVELKNKIDIPGFEINLSLCSFIVVILLLAKKFKV